MMLREWQPQNLNQLCKMVLRFHAFQLQAKPIGGKVFEDKMTGHM
jgi:hypothetical protein